MDSTDSLADIVIYNQVIFLVRFIIIGAVLGFMTAWVKKFWGFDVISAINWIELSARRYAESHGKEGNIWPLAVLLAGGLLLVNTIVGSFISGGV